MCAAVIAERRLRMEKRDEMQEGASMKEGYMNTTG